MRITQNMLYNNSVLDMNNSLFKMSRIQEQMDSMKRINRPSDDPSGYFEARGLTTNLGVIAVYQENAGLAEGWLGQADSTLLQASTVLTSIQELAEQGATGTLTASDRIDVAIQLRELFGELLNLANARFNGESIFAGQKTDSTAFEQTLFASVQDENLSQADVLGVSGSSDTSLLVEFTDSGTIGGGSDLGYRYSTDGGNSWTQAALAAGDQTLVLDGCTVTLANGANVTLSDDDSTGTRLLIRPSALYPGDGGGDPAVTLYGSSPVSGQAQGNFASNLLVRIDGDTALGSTIEYSYSTDNGSTWVEGNTADSDLLTLPGGFLELSPDGGTDLYDGDQFLITPDSADITLDMSPGGEVVINNVGVEVFGGLSQSTGASNASPAFADNPGLNIFETVGDLIGRLEINDVDGVGQALARLTEAHQHLEDAAADVGGRENRLTYAQYALEETAYAFETRLSAVEDADLTQLMVDLTKHQYAYQSVLATTSKILGMSLLDYF